MRAEIEWAEKKGRTLAEKLYVLPTTECLGPLFKRTMKCIFGHLKNYFQLLLGLLLVSNCSSSLAFLLLCGLHMKKCFSFFTTHKTCNRTDEKHVHHRIQDDGFSTHKNFRVDLSWHEIFCFSWMEHAQIGLHSTIFQSSSMPVRMIFLMRLSITLRWGVRFAIFEWRTWVCSSNCLLPDSHTTQQIGIINKNRPQSHANSNSIMLNFSSHKIRQFIIVSSIFSPFEEWGLTF